MVHVDSTNTVVLLVAAGPNSIDLKVGLRSSHAEDVYATVAKQVLGGQAVEGRRDRSK